MIYCFFQLNMTKIKGSHVFVSSQFLKLLSLPLEGIYFVGSRNKQAVEKTILSYTARFYSLNQLSEFHLTLKTIH